MLSSPSNLNNKKVFDLIYDDYQFAKVLSSFGIDFYNHYDDTLSDLCISKGISSDKLFGYRNSLQESFAFDKDSDCFLFNSCVRFCNKSIFNFKLLVLCNRSFFCIKRSL